MISHEEIHEKELDLGFNVGFEERLEECSGEKAGEKSDRTAEQRRGDAAHEFSFEEMPLYARVVRTEARAKSNSHRIERLEGETASLARIASAVEILANEQKNMSAQLAEVGKKVNELEHLPLRRLEQFVGYFLTALASLLAGMVISAFTG